MNHRSDIDRVLQVWMADGPVAIPDRVVDVVATRIAVNRQRRPWPFHGRTNVTTQIKLIAGLAAALVVAVLGYSLLPGIGGPGGPSTAPTPSAQPTAAPTTAPPAGARFPSWYTATDAKGVGILSAGSHTTRRFTPPFTFTVPDGWVNKDEEVGYYALFPDTPANQAEFARAGRLAQSIVMGPHSSPWFVCESVEDNRGATAAQMVSALMANEALTTSGLVDVEIGGLTGKQFDVRLNPDWTGTCAPTPEDPPGMNLADYRVRGTLLDLPDGGVIVVFVDSWYSADFEAFLAEAMPIVESFQFDLGQ